MALRGIYLLAAFILRYPSGDARTTVTSLPWSSALNITALQKFVALKSERNFDYGLTPLYNSSTPITVRINVQVGNIQGLSESTMDFTIDVFFRQAWSDYRLEFAEEIPDVASIGIPDKYYEDIWLPDTFFQNGKKETLHDITMENKMFRVYRDGTVVYSQRLRLTLWCTLNLQHFPLDEQKCDMRMASYRYSADEVLITWMPEEPFYVLDSQMPKFDLQNTSLGDCTLSLATGTFSCIYARFYFKRQFGFYLIELYIPSILIVALSWVSFVLDPRSVPARVSLGILTILAMTNQLSAVASDSLPKVSYIKSMDVWLTSCMSFLSASLIEFAIVNTLARSNTSRGRGAGSTGTANQFDHPPRRIVFGVLENSISLNFPKTIPSWTNRENGMCEPDLETGIPPVMTQEPSIHYRTALYVDRVSRVAFPVAFLIFNAVYWAIYW